VAVSSAAASSRATGTVPPGKRHAPSPMSDPGSPRPVWLGPRRTARRGTVTWAYVSPATVPEYIQPAGGATTARAGGAGRAGRRGGGGPGRGRTGGGGAGRSHRGPAGSGPTWGRGGGAGPRPEQPPKAEGGPPQAEGRPPQAEGRPPQAEGRPPQAEGRPPQA